MAFTSDFGAPLDEHETADDRYGSRTFAAILLAMPSLLFTPAGFIAAGALLRHSVTLGQSAEGLILSLVGLVIAFIIPGSFVVWYVWFKQKADEEYEANLAAERILKESRWR